MSILVVGSVALDTIETPFAKREEILGGAASLFSTAASLYDQVNLVAVVGTDFPRQHLRHFFEGDFVPPVQPHHRSAHGPHPNL